MEKFGRLTVVKTVAPKEYASGFMLKRVECKCRCGNKVVVDYRHLKSGNTTSCGCYKSELLADNMTGNTYAVTHGWSLHPIYNVYKSMMSRCYNKKNNPRWVDWGGRGIKVYKPWHDIDTFAKWAMANGWKKSLSLDRIDNDKSYHPNNCHFVTRVKQNNKRNNRRFEFQGKMQTIAEIARILGIEMRTLHARIQRGTPLSVAFSKKDLKTGNKLQRQLP